MNPDGIQKSEQRYLSVAEVQMTTAVKLMWFVASDKLYKALYDVKHGADSLNVFYLLCVTGLLLKVDCNWYVNLFMNEYFSAIYDKVRSINEN